MVLQRKGDKPLPVGEQRKLSMMRQALARATSKNSIGGQPKKGGHKPKPVSLPAMPWDSK